MVNLSVEEVSVLKNLVRLRDKQVDIEQLNNTKIRNGLIGMVQCFLMSNYIGEEFSDSEGRQKAQSIIDELSDKSACLLTDGLATAMVMGYLQNLNSDRSVKTTGEFGYEFIEEGLSAIVNSKLAEFISSDTAGSLIQSGLHASIRDIPAEEYYNGVYHSDIEFLNNALVANIDDGYNIDMLKAIRERDDIATSIKTYMTDLKAVYQVVFEDGFGIHPYVGVLTSKSGFHEIDSKNKGVAITRGRETLRKLAERMSRRFDTGLVISNSRQFDYTEVFNNDKTVYFPYKILEYALGRCSSLNLNRREYLPHASSNNWSAYYKAYVGENLQSILERGYYKAIESVLKSESVIDCDFVDFNNESYDDFLFEKYSGASADKVNAMIVKLVNSMKCCYVLTRYGYLVKTVANVGVRVTNSRSYDFFNASPESSRALFFNLVGVNENEIFQAPYSLTNGVTSDFGVELSVSVYDYKYEINPTLSKAEPLFGYVVAKQNAKKGVVVDWENILIGETMAGKELYASALSSLKMQLNFIHSIYAGSRAGKGVMTMNILASAIASRKPVFYADRKPDIISMLYRNSGGRMFAVNGGLYNPEFDIYGDFAEGGSALSGWENTQNYLRANPKVMELFDANTTSYYSVLGDLVYFRTCMFLLGLCVLRGKMKGVMDEERQRYLNGDDGIIIVIDEITGYQNSIMRVLSDINSTLVRKALGVADVDTLLARKDDLEASIEIKQQEIIEVNKESQVMKKEREIEQIKRDISMLIDEQGVYAGTFFKKIRDSFSTLKGSKVANFKNKEFRYSDIFVLGQDLEVPYYASSIPNVTGTVSPVFFPLKADKKDYYANFKNGCIIRSFLEELGEQDWFLGRNPDYAYGDKPIDSRVKKTLDDDGNWEYVGKHTTNEIRNRDDSEYNSILFKPYLVLNECYEENPESIKYDEKGNPISSESKYQYVTQCRERVNQTAGGKDLWSTVRTKHLTQDAKETYSEDNPNYGSLEPGIGFRGLVSEMAGGMSDGEMSDALARSGEGADWVARKMGYSGWRELIFDLSPEGLFSFDDMVNAVCNPSDYTMETRLPLYSKLGLLGDSSSGTGGSYSDAAEKYDFEGEYDEVYESGSDDGRMSQYELTSLAEYLVSNYSKFSGAKYDKVVKMLVNKLIEWGW